MVLLTISNDINNDHHLSYTCFNIKKNNKEKQNILDDLQKKNDKEKQNDKEKINDKEKQNDKENNKEKQNDKEQINYKENNKEEINDKENNKEEINNKENNKEEINDKEKIIIPIFLNRKFTINIENQYKTEKKENRIKYNTCLQTFLIYDSFVENEQNIIDNKIKCIENLLEEKKLLIKIHNITISNYILTLFVCSKNIVNYIKKPKQNNFFIDLYKKGIKENKNKEILDSILNININKGHLQKKILENNNLTFYDLYNELKKIEYLE